MVEWFPGPNAARTQWREHRTMGASRLKHKKCQTNSAQNGTNDVAIQARAMEWRRSIRVREKSESIGVGCWSAHARNEKCQTNSAQHRPEI
jgi:hypothetical protein